MDNSQVYEILCVGPFNSGTNLLNNILNNAYCINIKHKKNVKILHPDEITEEVDSDLKKYSLKHVFSEEILQKYIGCKNRGIIVLYKNIYNWIYSIHKCPYHLVFENLFTTVEFDGNKFDNIIELYNHYYKIYINIIKKNNNIIFIDYYKLINHKISFNYINYKLSKLGVRINNKLKLFEELSKPSKHHGKCINNSRIALNNYPINQELVKNFIIRNTNLIDKVDANITNFFEN